MYGAFEFHGRSRLFPFLDHNAPTLQMLVDFCEDAYTFLGDSASNVVGLHCKVRLQAHCFWFCIFVVIRSVFVVVRFSLFYLLWGIQCRRFVVPRGLCENVEFALSG